MDDSTSKLGLPPGTIVHTGPKRVDQMTFRIIDFDEEDLEILPGERADECRPTDKEEITRWVHVNGVHEVGQIERISLNFRVHPLVIEDISSTNQRPKIEIMRDGLYIVLRAFTYDKGQDRIFSEQISLILGNGYVLSFQESADDLFEPIIKRLLHKETRLRSGGSDYLAYSILDLIVDYYFEVLETVSEKIESLEDEIITKSTDDSLSSLYALKRDLLQMKKYIWPLQEVVHKLTRDETGLIQQETHPYMRDLYDHILRVVDHIETYRDSLTAMLDIYLTSISNRMNEVMKVLTVISTVFIPITFIASIYGMNFEYMPELAIPFAYPMVLAVMAIMSIILLGYFRKIRWL